MAHTLGKQFLHRNLKQQQHGKPLQASAGITKPVPEKKVTG